MQKHHKYKHLSTSEQPSTKTATMHVNITLSVCTFVTTVTDHQEFQAPNKFQTSYNTCMGVSQELDLGLSYLLYFWRFKEPRLWL